MNANKKHRLSKSERNSIKTARRQFRKTGTHETEKYLTSIRQSRESGITMKAGDWQ